MDEVEARRAVAAATSVAEANGLDVDETVVLNRSNRLVVHLLPCDTVARVSPAGWFSATREVEVARRLAATGAPVIALDPRVEPRVVERDGFEIALWEFVDALPDVALPPDDYAPALERLHGALRRVEMDAPHATDRFVAIQRWLTDPALTPDLADADRALLVERLAPPAGVRAGGRGEQLLHGEPHAGNVLATDEGLRFIDFENCARGPVELDLAWMPREVSERYRGADPALVGECRATVLALIAAHRWRVDDRHPSGRRSGVAFLDAVRAGPPWPALDEVTW